MQTKNKLLSVLSAISIILTVICLWGFKRPEPDAASCYFNGREYSNGSTSSLGSICTYKCNNGTWNCISCTYRLCPIKIASTSKEPMFCYVKGKKYSEGSPSNGKKKYKICHDGKWIKPVYNTSDQK